MKGIAWLVAAGLLLVGGARAAGRPPTHEAQHHRYLVVMKHDAEDCLASLEAFARQHQKLLSQVTWGCHAGDHHGYVFLDAASEQEALARLPEAARASASARAVVMLSTADELREARHIADQAVSLQRAE